MFRGISSSKPGGNSGPDEKDREDEPVLDLLRGSKVLDVAIGELWGSRGGLFCGDMIIWERLKDSIFE